jgi:hypothetical protein
MSGYMMIEEAMMQPHRPNGIKPNPVRMLLAAGPRLMEVSLRMRRFLTAKAFDLDAANIGLVQMVFRRPLRRADDFWFELGGGNRISLRPIFDSPMKQTDPFGNDNYTVGFNLT